MGLDLDGNGEKQYRVIKYDESTGVAQVMAMYDTLTSAFNETSVTTTLGDLTIEKYENSTLDTYLNTTWYNTLTDATKAAIIPESIICDVWYNDGESDPQGDPVYEGTIQDTYGTTSYSISKYAGGTLNIGNRNVFVLGVQDIIDYLNDPSVQVDTSVILCSVNIWKMFWNITTQPNSLHLRLRSSGEFSSKVWMLMPQGYPSAGPTTWIRPVRPCLNLNLTKFPYRVLEPAAPPKGSIIALDLDGQGKKEYRVIKSSGSVAQVMGMFDDLSSMYNRVTTNTTMGSLTVQKYEESTLDTYLNTIWYNTLTSEAKAAIIPENIICDAWYWSTSTALGNPRYSGTAGNTVPGTSNYSIGKYAGGTLNIGERNVFVLGVQDVIDYLNDLSVQVDTTAILRNVNIWKMFWNDETPHSNIYTWLRSARADGSNGAMYMRGGYGDLRSDTPGSLNVVRPALNLDLAQLHYDVIETPPVIETETWYFKDGTTEQITTLGENANVNFTSNGENFSLLRAIDVSIIYYDNTQVCLGTRKGWLDEAYRTITLSSPATGDLLTWLQANAVKQ